MIDRRQYIQLYDGSTCRTKTIQVSQLHRKGRSQVPYCSVLQLVTSLLHLILQLQNTLVIRQFEIAYIAKNLMLYRTITSK